MKDFICIQTKSPKKELSIYRIKNNQPEHITSYHKYDHTDTIEETIIYLSENGFIPKKYRNASLYELRNNGYRFTEITI